jgi:hypothetical protein
LSPITKKLVDLKAKLTLGNRCYPGRIENLSDNDICLLASSSIPSHESCQGAECTLEFSHPSGEVLNLNCTVKCSYKTPPHGLTNSMIMNVTDPPTQYQELLKTL